MYRLEFVFVLLSLIVISVTCIESNFYREEPCAQVGGYCVLENECPQAVQGKDKGLCHGQKKDGAVCCRNFPQDQVNCYQLHNTCMEQCPENLRLGPKGCPTGQHCCVLVN